MSVVMLNMYEFCNDCVEVLECGTPCKRYMEHMDKLIDESIMKGIDKLSQM